MKTPALNFYLCFKKKSVDIFTRHRLSLTVQTSDITMHNSARIEKYNAARAGTFFNADSLENIGLQVQFLSWFPIHKILHISIITLNNSTNKLVSSQSNKNMRRSMLGRNESLSDYFRLLIITGLKRNWCKH